MPNRLFTRGARLFAAAFVVSLAACERVVEVDLPEGERLLVVEARVERVAGQTSGRQRVRLTTTYPYFNKAAPPPARGATVRLSDDAGNAATVVESAAEPGVYETGAFVGEPGRAYLLTIDWEGDRYEARDTMPRVAPIDTLYFAERNGVLGPREGLRATIDFRDPAGSRDYYLWDQLVDGARLIAPDSAFRIRVVASDDLIAGQRVTGFQPYDGIAVRAGQTVTVRQLGLSGQAYRYWLAVSDQTINDGSPFAVTPASVRGNVANRTHPARRALGYFFASEVAEATRTVP